MRTGGGALKTDGEILFHGSNLAPHDDGQILLESMHALTGVSVAASIENPLVGILPNSAALNSQVGEAIDSNTTAAVAPSASASSHGADVVLIDAHLQDSGILAQAVKPWAQLFMFDSSRDSAHDVLASVATWAETTGSKIQSLAILSHGSAGAFEVGNQWIDTTTLEQSAPEWQRLSHVLAEGANIEIFGCDTAAPGSDGQLLVNRLASLTGADVFASDNFTGKGGDWVLEIASVGDAQELADGLNLPLNLAALQESGATLAWYDPAWGYRNVITIDHTKVAANQTNFPVLISTTNPNWRSTGNGGQVGKSDGSDFVFTLADGVTKLDYEIEKYDPTTGQLVAWVRVPTLSSSTDTSIDLYYGNAGAADAQNAAGVWPAGIGVWHLANDPGPGAAGDIKDADASPLNGTAAATMTSTDLVTGRIGDAVNFDGSAGYIDFTTATDVGNTFTISAWIKPDSTGSSTIKTIAANSSSGSTTNGWRFFMNSSGTNDGKIIFETGNGTTGNSASTSVGVATFDQWNHVAVTVNRASGTAQIYVNGVDVTFDNTIRNDFATSSDWEIGRMETSNLYFKGTIDEFQIANIAPAASWIATEYANQNAPGTFYAITTVNEAPVNNLPAAQSTNEDTTKVFSSGNGNQISITDPDAGSTEQVTLSATNGNLTLAGTTGLTFTAGDGAADATMTFYGTVAAINTALNGLSYSPTANYNGAASLTITTTDSGVVSLNIDAGLQGHYTFENTGALGTDTSPAAGYAGTVSGATAASDGTRGNVLSLDGNDYVQMTGHLGDSANVTLAAWINLTTADTGGSEVISLGDSVTLRADDAAGLKGFFYNGSTWISTSYATTLAGTGWHHVAYSFNDAGNAANLYLDGVLVGTTSTTNSISYTKGANSFIGKHGNGGTSFDFTGKIDDARVYNRVLTASEIATLATDLPRTDTDTVAISVTAVNDAPVRTAGSPSPINVNEDSADSTAVTLGMSSLTYGPGGGSDESGQTLTYKVTAIPSFMTLWLSDGTTQVTANTTVTLAQLQGLMYKTVADANGSGNLTWTVQDNGGTSNGGVDTLTENLSITVSSVNDAPTIANGAMVTMTGTNEDTISSGTTANTILTGASWADVDTSALKWLAITGKTGNGTWQYSTDGTSWAAFGSVSATNALLITSTTQVRYIPDGQNGETATFSFMAWDQTSGTASTNGAPGYANPSSGGGTSAYSSQSASASLSVTSVNDAPTMVSNAMVTLPNTNKTTTSNSTTADTILLSASWVDVDLGAPKGIAITGMTGNGIWQYSTDGTAWATFGSVSASSALLITSTTQVRYIPDGVTSETATFTFVAWDQASGTASTNGSASYANPGSGGGTTAFSSQAATASLTVTSLIDANGANNSVNENAANGTLVGITAQLSGDNGATFSLVDDAGGRFAIDASTGMVSVADGTLLNREAAASHDITIRATSADGSTADSVFTIAVLDVNEFAVTAPSDANAAPNQVNENAATGTVVGLTAQATDADATTNTVAFSLVDDAGGRFAIDTSTGVVSVADGTLLNREAAASHDITIRATSADGSTADSVFTINVVSGLVLSLPPAQSVLSFSVVFSSANGNAISISNVGAGNNLSQVTLSTQNGQLTLGSVAGLAFLVGDGTADSSMTFVGNLTAVNGAINGLIFTPVNSTTGILQVQVDDLGSSGSGSPKTAQGQVAVQTIFAPTGGGGAGTGGTSGGGSGESGSTGGTSGGSNGGGSSGNQNNNPPPPSPHDGFSDPRERSRFNAGLGQRRTESAAPLRTDRIALLNEVEGDLQMLDDGDFTSLAARTGRNTIAAAMGMRSVSDLQFLIDEYAAFDDGSSRNQVSGNLIVGTALSFVVFASAGYALWVLRAGALLAQASVSLPTWAHFDPLPVLDFADKQAKRQPRRRDDEPDEAQSPDFFDSLTTPN